MYVIMIRTCNLDSFGFGITRFNDRDVEQISFQSHSVTSNFVYSLVAATSMLDSLEQLHSLLTLELSMKMTIW